MEGVRLEQVLELPDGRVRVGRVDECVELLERRPNGQARANGRAEVLADADVVLECLLPVLLLENRTSVHADEGGEGERTA
jgi:hypothetical protein